MDTKILYINLYFLSIIKMITSVIYAKEDRDIVTIDIPYFFIQTPIYEKPVEDEIIMKQKKVLVDI